MLEPSYIEQLPDRLVELYSQVEMDIIESMAKRIGKMDFIPSAEWQYKKLIEMGYIHDDIIKKLSAVSGIHKDELQKLMQESGVKALNSDNKIYRKAGLEPPLLSTSPNLQKVLQAGFESTNGLFQNLTRTMANTATKQFENALDRSWLQINSGAFDYNTAINTAIKDLSSKGLATIVYPSGHTDYLDVAVRRATVTGVNQMALKMQDALASEMGCDLVETSAHAGARPSHVKWQGQIFSRSGKNPKYPDFTSSTGYGTGLGLGGWNCRHSFFPFFEGMEPVYTQEELNKMNAPKYKYNGKMITEYEATQKQRYIERNIRKYKRESVGFEAAGLPTNASAAKLKRWQDIQGDFIGQTGLKRQYDRENASFVQKKNVDKYSESGIIKTGSETMALENQRYGRNKNTLVNNTYIESGEYRRKFDNATDKPQVNKVLYNKSKEALKHRSGTALEDMFWIDSETGRVILEVTDSNVERSIVYTERIKKVINNEDNIITMHTHPSSTPPSASDFNSCYRNNYKQGIITCHNGKVFAYTSSQEINQNLYNIYIASYIADGYNEFDAQVKTIEKLKQNHIIDFWEVK